MPHHGSSSPKIFTAEKQTRRGTDEKCIDNLKFEVCKLKIKDSWIVIRKRVYVQYLSCLINKQK